MSSKIRLARVDPKKIETPPVRITSAWDPADYEVFKQSIAADGIAQPIVCVKEGETFWLADGQHRLQEALLQGLPRVDVAYKEGSLVDAMTRNLYLNRLRGKTKASEEVQLLKFLQEEKGLSLEKIQDRTGISMERLEQRLAIGNADPVVLSALDEEQIGVGVAYQLSRLPNKEGQVKLLMELLRLIPPPTTTWVRDIVDGALQLIEERRQQKEEPEPIIPVRTIRCHMCEERYEAKEMRGVNLCDTCLGVAKKYIQDLKQKQRGKPSPEEALIHRIIPEPTEEG